MTACEAESVRSAALFEPTLVRRVLAVVRRHRLFQPGNKIMAAVSGGPDSVALLHLLHELRPEWRLDLSVIHVNYGLRGKESDEDEQFVRRLCRRLAVPCIVRRIDLLRDMEAGRHRSLQARARDVRYRIMKEVAAAEGVNRVALGHTADDQAETILMWLLRGAGITGLAGMPIVREELFIRPLLTVARGDAAAPRGRPAMTCAAEPRRGCRLRISRRFFSARSRPRRQRPRRSRPGWPWRTCR